MQQNSAKDDRAQMHVVFVVYPDVSLLDLTGPLQVMNWAKSMETGEQAYTVHVVSQSGGDIQSDTILPVRTDSLEPWLNTPIHTLIIVGGDGVYPAIADPVFVENIRTLAAQSSRVCSVCSGAILLATAGLLNNRRAVTHWEDTDYLIKKFPQVKVERDPLYIKDGQIWTTAGVTSGIDMALALVAEDLGHEAALERARGIIAYMVRPGGQSQFSPALERQRSARAGRFEALHAWITENLDKDLDVKTLASRENMSLRNFHRTYTEVIGTTPAKAVANMRLEAARDMLETQSISIKEVARRCGFLSESRMRQAFRRTLGVSPGAYRERFRL